MNVLQLLITITSNESCAKYSLNLYLQGKDSEVNFLFGRCTAATRFLDAPDLLSCSGTMIVTHGWRPVVWPDDTLAVDLVLFSISEPSLLLRSSLCIAVKYLFPKHVSYQLQIGQCLSSRGPSMLGNTKQGFLDNTPQLFPSTVLINKTCSE